MCQKLNIKLVVSRQSYCSDKGTLKNSDPHTGALYFATALHGPCLLLLPLLLSAGLSPLSS